MNCIMHSSNKFVVSCIYRYWLSSLQDCVYMYPAFYGHIDNYEKHVFCLLHAICTRLIHTIRPLICFLSELQHIYSFIALLIHLHRTLVKKYSASICTLYIWVANAQPYFAALYGTCYDYRWCLLPAHIYYYDNGVVSIVSIIILFDVPYTPNRLSIYLQSLR